MRIKDVQCYETTRHGDSNPAGVMPARGIRDSEPSKVGACMQKGGCCVCGSSNGRTFAEIRGVPIHSNVLAVSHSQALGVPRGDLEMRCCTDCGHIYNAAFSLRETEYSSDYENSLFVSERYRAYASSLAKEVIEKFSLRSKKVVEIGCGSGDFLKILCETGENDGIGFDPSASAGRAVIEHPRINFIRDYYSSRHGNLDADLLCCRHVLEHVGFPVTFLKDLGRGLAKGKKGGLFVEVPDVLFILKEHSVWDLIYEHCSYFSTSSLYRLLSLCGFKTHGIRSTFDGQFLCAYAEQTENGTFTEGKAPDTDKADVLHHAEIFHKVFQQQVRSWRKRLRFFETSREKAVVWGAGSKGVTFLNLLQEQGSVEYVVDINEHKQGKYIPGSGQRIVAPDFLKKYRPDSVILMNPAYEEEVRKTLSELGLHPGILPVNRPGEAEEEA